LFEKTVGRRHANRDKNWKHIKFEAWLDIDHWNGFAPGKNISMPF